MLPVGALETREVVVVAPQHVGRGRQPLQVVSFERQRPIGGEKGGVSTGPGAPRRGLAPALELFGGLHEISAQDLTHRAYGVFTAVRGRNATSRPSGRLGGDEGPA